MEQNPSKVENIADEDMSFCTPIESMKINAVTFEEEIRDNPQRYKSKIQMYPIDYENEDMSFCSPMESIKEKRPSLTEEIRNNPEKYKRITR